MKECNGGGPEECRTVHESSCTTKYLEKKPGVQVLDTKCEKLPVRVCGAGCVVKNGGEECHDKVVTSVVDKPEEVCDINPEKVCRVTNKLVPTLIPQEECSMVPKETCHLSFSNAAPSKKMQLTKWCLDKSKDFAIKEDLKDIAKINAFNDGIQNFANIEGRKLVAIKDTKDTDAFIGQDISVDILTAPLFDFENDIVENQDIEIGDLFTAQEFNDDKEFNFSKLLQNIIEDKIIKTTARSDFVSSLESPYHLNGEGSPEVSRISPLNITEDAVTEISTANVDNLEPETGILVEDVTVTIEKNNDASDFSAFLAGENSITKPAINSKDGMSVENIFSSRPEHNKTEAQEKTIRGLREGRKGRWVRRRIRVQKRE